MLSSGNIRTLSTNTSLVNNCVQSCSQNSEAAAVSAVVSQIDAAAHGVVKSVT
jgi:hypothetical protein|eukprot:COSAG01_NODE_704_length_14147_cov_5.083648_6_plen_53_part_00